HRRSIDRPRAVLEQRGFEQADLAGNRDLREQPLTERQTLRSPKIPERSVTVLEFFRSRVDERPRAAGPEIDAHHLELLVRVDYRESRTPSDQHRTCVARRLRQAPVVIANLVLREIDDDARGPRRHDAFELVLTERAPVPVPHALDESVER